jgi:hypothetical protein
MEADDGSRASPSLQGTSVRARDTGLMLAARVALGRSLGGRCLTPQSHAHANPGIC